MSATKKNQLLFFSRSFDQTDAVVNDFFAAIAAGLEINLSDIGYGSPQAPIEKCRDLIASAGGVFVVAVRRTPLKNGRFAMPDACRDEIGMAYGLRKPIVIFCEDGVEVEGFAKHYGTRQTFSRIDLHKPNHIRDTIRAIRELYLKVIGDFPIQTDMMRADIYSEGTKLLADLRRDSKGWFWELIVKKRLIFNEDLNQPLTDGTWASSAIAVPESAPRILFSINPLESSRKFKLTPSLRRHTALLVDCVTSVSPKPKKGDWLEYEAKSQSRYLNPLVMEDLLSRDSPYVIGGKQYFCLEGLVPVQLTEKLEIELRFERGYPIHKSSPCMVSGPHSNSLDRLDTEETARMVCTERDTIGGETRVRTLVHKPRQNYLYGIAWNPLPTDSLDKAHASGTGNAEARS